jgi:hypothetical protein
MEQLSDLKHSKAYFSSVIKKSASSAQAKLGNNGAKRKGGIITSPSVSRELELYRMLFSCKLLRNR